MSLPLAYQPYRQPKHDDNTQSTPSQSHGLSSGSSATGLSADGTWETDNSLVSYEDKRKAQNRAAQRAFRERKECHIRDLNERFVQLQQKLSTLREENDQRRQEITAALAENYTLKEMESTRVAFQHDFTSTLTYASFADSVAPGDHDKRPTHRITTDPNTGERLMDLGATWEFIQQHARFQEGTLDLEKVCNYLRQQVQCDGQGPVFVESLFDSQLQA
ncbi:hypothetical protein BDV40DRAFT_295019 [Aspergillus tamarii]|uniref:BZIP domain-containing protein n=1 Tax=Aspergillus tamarii TaxID=41984 RepID=A0A5N6VAK4_ASPTM|nr:hypothetical protein BDV40DRAFT_295019 [Aspergillus tamarii]